MLPAFKTFLIDDYFFRRRLTIPIKPKPKIAKEAGSGTIEMLPVLPVVPGKNSLVATCSPIRSTKFVLNAWKVNVSEWFNVIPLLGLDFHPAIPPGPELLLSVDQGPKLPVKLLFVTVRSLLSDKA